MNRGRWMIGIDGIFILVLFMFMNLVMVWVGYDTGRGEQGGVRVVLPNDVRRASVYEGDPSLLSGYIRNDSLFLNFEGY